MRRYLGYVTSCPNETRPNSNPLRSCVPMSSVTLCTKCGSDVHTFTYATSTYDEPVIDRNCGRPMIQWPTKPVVWRRLLSLSCYVFLAHEIA